MRVKVTHSIGDLASDLRRIPKIARKDMARTVADSAKEGNRIAKAFASEQHTMNSDVDADYPPAFTAERRGPLTWEYGADQAIGDGSKSPGYEWGSINQAYPHLDHARSADIIGPKFAAAVALLPDRWFWPS